MLWLCILIRLRTRETNVSKELRFSDEILTEKDPEPIENDETLHNNEIQSQISHFVDQQRRQVTHDERRNGDRRDHEQRMVDVMRSSNRDQFLTPEETCREIYP